MRKVDFHILAESSRLPALRYTCQLIEQAYNEQQRVYIHVDTDEVATQLDTLLWTYRENSFLPHNIYREDGEHPPIQIGNTNHPPADKTILVNLSKTIPAFFPQFNHIIEIVFADTVVQQLARERFKQYRDHGCELTTHKIKANEP